MRGASVAVVGGGVIGASAAYHLAVNGVRDVVVIDRSDSPGAGSTSKATGGFRAQFATPINVRLSLLSRESLLRFRDDTGVDPGYSQVGYLWLATSNRELEALRAAQSVQHAEGLTEAIEVDRETAASLNGAISLDGIVGGAFCPTDGFIRPLEILRGYLEAAERLGARVEWNAEVIGFRCDFNGRISAAQTTRGDIPVDKVVNAAGPWAAELAAMAGSFLPVTPLRRQVAVTERGNWLQATTPMTIFLDDGFHLRVKEERVVLCWPTPGVTGSPYDMRVEREWIDAVEAKAHRRVPVLRGAHIDREACYAGLYEMSPDKHAIVGLSSECENLFFVNGSSGHGVMHAPALGRAIADLICLRQPQLDVSQLRPSRFAEGDAVQAPELL